MFLHVDEIWNSTGTPMAREQHAKTLYQTVVEAIRQQVESGNLIMDQKLPSESALSKIHAVGRNTVRRAIHELVNDGVLRTVPGVGTFVVNQRLDKSADYLLGFTHEMQLRGKDVSSRVLEAKIIAADPLLSRRLQIQLGAEVVFLYRVRLMDGEPTAIERAYLPHQLCPGILEYDFSTTSLYETLSTIYRRMPDHAEQIIEAGIATPEVSTLLGLTPPAVVLMFHRETRLASGQVIEYVDSELRGDRFRFYTNLQLHTSAAGAAFQMLPLQLEADVY
ncbi:MAG: GntR family transcriptional regulator [Chloroflexi bacterium]|nr:GntR family transcriptional regulator [Chloroflexota bacterium]